MEKNHGKSFFFVGLRKLLDEQQDVAKEEGGIFVNCSDWQSCSTGEEGTFFHNL